MVITVKCKGWVRKQSWLMVLVWRLLGMTEEEHEKLRVPGVSVEHLTEYLLNIVRHIAATPACLIIVESTRNFFYTSHGEFSP